MCNDSKKIWELIDWKGYCKGDELSNELPEIESLAKQFQSKDNPSDVNDLVDIDFGDKCVNVLDEEILVEELETAVKRLKEGKATADGWAPRMITEVKDCLFPILLLSLIHI